MKPGSVIICYLFLYRKIKLLQIICQRRTKKTIIKYKRSVPIPEELVQAPGVQDYFSIKLLWQYLSRIPVNKYTSIGIQRDGV